MTIIATLECLKRDEDTAVSGSVLACPFTLYFASSIPMEQILAGWERSQLSPWLVFLLFPGFLFMAPVKLVTSPLHWNCHQKAIYRSWIKKNRVPETHLGLEGPLSWPRVVILILCSSCWYNFPCSLFLFQGQQRTESCKGLIWAHIGFCWPWPTRAMVDVQRVLLAPEDSFVLCIAMNSYYSVCSSAS